MAHMKDKTGWIVVDGKREIPIGLVNDEGKHVGVTGYVYLHYRKKHALTEAKKLNTAWKINSIHVIKAVVTKLRGYK